ncbi:MAG: response regulator transcription factor [Tissierellia bacterium]|nr:response regulator transcription factor [Tissierellia bacterium]
MLSVLFISDLISKDNSYDAKEILHPGFTTKDIDEVIEFCNKNTIDILLVETGSINDISFAEFLVKFNNAIPSVKTVCIAEDITSIPKNFSNTGVFSLLSRDISYKELVSSLNFIKKGYNIFPSTQTSLIHSIDKLTNLTSRELEILNLLCQALSREEISKLLNITENTVKTHIQNILSKTEYKSISKLALDLLVRGNLREDSSDY